MQPPTKKCLDFLTTDAVSLVRVFETHTFFWADCLLRSKRQIDERSEAIPGPRETGCKTITKNLILTVKRYCLPLIKTGYNGIKGFEIQDK